MEDERRYFAELLVLAAEKRALKKAVCSKPRDAGDVRAVVTLRHIGGRDCLQAEIFRADNKAMHENLPAEVGEGLLALLARYGQVNLLTAAGDCEMKCGKRGTVTVLGGEKLRKALEGMQESELPVPENDRKKQYILSGEEPFLRLLDVSDAGGRVKDKKQAKFRQINRFLELVRDCQEHLPKEGVLRICDLCCGKSYLSFAAYHYFANVLGREVRMTGVDLKPDVIAYCGDVAKRLGWSGLEFVCGDVSRYNAGGAVDLVISLHACDAATDALRLKYLEGHGYAVAALELIDPEETPKNIMLRGILREKPDAAAMEAARMEYLDARNFLTGGKANVQTVLCPDVWG